MMVVDNEYISGEANPDNIEKSPITQMVSDPPENSNTNSMDNTILRIASQILRVASVKLSQTPYVGAAAIFLLAICLSSQSVTYFLLREFIRTVLRIIGTALGVGLGLGFAMHVYEALGRLSNDHGLGNSQQQVQKARESEDRSVGRAYSIGTPPSSRKNTGPLRRTVRPIGWSRTATNGGTSSISAGGGSSNNVSTNSAIHDSRPNGNYANLMTNAGYVVPQHILRGQCLRRNDLIGASTPTSAIRGLCSTNKCDAGTYLMNTMFPNLSNCINQEIGIFVDLLVRDFISCWYRKVDFGVKYTDPALVSSLQENVVGESIKSDKQKNKSPHATTSSKNDKPNNFGGGEKEMLLSLDTVRSSPFMDATYDALIHVLGTIATAAGERVNVMDLVLIQVVKALGKTLKVYRECRLQAQKKAQKNENKMKKAFKVANEQHHQHIERQSSGKNLGVTNDAGRLKGNLEPNSLKSPIAAVAVTSTAGVSKEKYSNSSSPIKKGSTNAKKVHKFTGNTINSTTDSKMINNFYEARVPSTENVKNKSSNNSTTTVSEMAIAREFLVSGKLHEAITFGLDIPSIIFADDTSPKNNATSENCANNIHKSSSSKSINDMPSEEKINNVVDRDAVLERRLFGTTNCKNDASTKDCDEDGKTQSSSRGVLYECELDYNRVLSSLILRKIVQPGQMASSVIRCMGVEMLAGCVLNPTMGFFVPETINGWIISGISFLLGIGDYSGENDDATVATNFTEELSKVSKHDWEPSIVGGTRPESEASLENALFKLDGHNNNIDRKQSISDDTMTISDSSFMRPVQISESNDPSGIDSDDEYSEGDTMLEENDENDTNTKERNNTIKEQQEKVENLLPLLTLAVAEVQNYASTVNSEGEVEWSASSCRSAVCQLVLVIEAALLFGRRSKPILSNNSSLANNKEDVPSYESLSVMLMEMTTDIEAFEKRNMEEFSDISAVDIESGDIADDGSDDDTTDDQNYQIDETSTLRTLIAAWLHTGCVYRTMKVFSQSTYLLRKFYKSSGLFCSTDLSKSFVMQLKGIDRVEVLVDTMAVLSAQSLTNFAVTGYALQDVPPTSRFHKASISPKSPQGSRNGENTTPHWPGAYIKANMKANLSANKQRLTRLVDAIQVPQNTLVSTFTIDSKKKEISNHLDFRKNEAFASNLRTDRKRRLDSWKKIVDQYIAPEWTNRCTTGSQLRELHELAAAFCNLTVSISTKNGEGNNGVFMEAVASRRKLEVPDDDTSFLLRAQPRALVPVGVHRDKRHHSANFKCYAATYIEAITNTETLRYNGGRYIRRCTLRYYPSDRTSTVEDVKPIDMDSTSQGTLPLRLQRERNICQKAKNPGSVLSGGVMDPSDFTCSPRTGRALDFVYRMGLFERPVAEISGKRFTIHDNTLLGPHRADGSCLEVSDSSLTVALIIAGGLSSSSLKSEQSAENCEQGSNEKKSVTSVTDVNNISIKLKRRGAQGEGVVEHVKTCRASFIRAALYVASARQEAQLQCLIVCVKDGSARMATKARVNAFLKPTRTLLDLVTSQQREQNEQLMLRHLGIGVMNIDRAQLCRNNILEPRHPSVLRRLSALVECIVEQNDVALYRIRCVALSEVLGIEDKNNTSDNLSDTNIYREEWIVFRQLRDVTSLHKHLKSQVAESPARFTFAGPGQKKVRNSLVPSLFGGSGKTAPLIPTKKSLGKRQNLVNQYFRQIVSPNHFLSNSPEVICFFAAHEPLSVEDTSVDSSTFSTPDTWGRTERKKILLKTFNIEKENPSYGFNSEKRRTSTGNDEGLNNSKDKIHGSTGNKASRTREKKSENDQATSAMLKSIQTRIDMISLSEVRDAFFEFLRYQYDLDNASFWQSRMFSAIKTISYMLIGGKDFNKMLLKLHREHLTDEKISGLLVYMREILWPGGVFFTSGPPLTVVQKSSLKDQARKMLPQAFPDQLRMVLGQEFTEEGLDMLHEMLQNRIVVKSLGYMIIDMIWLEIFPELSDTLSGAKALDSDL